MKRTRFLAAALAAAALLGLASCQDFFTSSWASWAAGDPSLPSNLTAAQAIDIADRAVLNRDTALARALLPQMAAFVAGTPSDAMVAAAVSTAVLASGIDAAFGEALAALGTDVIEGGGTLTPAQITALAAILDSVTVSADAVAVFTYLDGQPVADMAAAGITAADYVMAASALLLSDVGTAAGIDALIFSSTYAPGPNDALISALIADATAQWPGDDLLSAMSDLLNVL